MDDAADRRDSSSHGPFWSFPKDRDGAAKALQVWDGCVSRSDCLHTITAMTSASSTLGGVLRSGDEFAEPRLRSCSEHQLSDKQADVVVAALRCAAGTVMRMRSWHNAKLDGPKFCSYPPGGFFRAHRDRSADVQDPVAVRARSLSIVCMLNDDDPRGGLPTFDGGALVIYVPQQDGSVSPINLRPTAGSIVTFSADLMHEVRPVRDGTRFTSIAWLYDPHPSDIEEEQ